MFSSAPRKPSLDSYASAKIAWQKTRNPLRYETAIVVDELLEAVFAGPGEVMLSVDSTCIREGEEDEATLVPADVEVGMINGSFSTPPMIGTVAIVISSDPYIVAQRVV